ncbi:lysylphosphatidylglycerol synthase domain-containing protein [Leifsonia sp. NPDC077715]|uniref:lysylphosphatidylglycerol synthase domain-containing protein n=1 Tax=Leifsonia sp. NPDC077715 TaxID=3155539 RepID=UPI00344A0F2B
MAAMTAVRRRPMLGRILRSRRVSVIARLLVGGAVLVAVVLRVGGAPFLHGLASVDATTVIVAIVLCAVATAAAAWRWRLIAVRLGAELRWGTAVGMYYRSQFVNSVLPGGVVGDVQRAVDHGRSTDRLGAAARAVAVERTAGQAVQLAVTLVVLVLVGPRFAGWLLPVIGIGLTAAAVGIAVTALASSRVRGVLRHEAAELRAGLGSPATAIQVVAASLVVVACHVATFAVSVVAVGAGARPAQLLVLALVVLLATSFPLSVGGWGPREGVAGWAFAVAGFGAATGVSAATVFGVLAVVSVLPGVLVFRVAPAVASLLTRFVASLGSGRNHDRHPLRHPQLRGLARRVPRHRRAAAAGALEPGGLRPGG